MKVAMPQLTVDWYGAMFPDQKKPKNKQTETEKTQRLHAFLWRKKKSGAYFQNPRAELRLDLTCKRFTSQPIYLQMSA